MRKSKAVVGRKTKSKNIRNVTDETRPWQDMIDLEYIAEVTGITSFTREQVFQRYCEKDGDILGISPFFTRDLYYNVHPELRRNGSNAFRHYMEHGRYENRDPHPLFSVAYVTSQLRAAAVQFDSADLYCDFLSGRLEVSPHKLIDIEYVRKQLGDELSARDVFRLVADARKSLSVAPHPLFDPDFYRVQNKQTFANELIDYVCDRSVCKKPCAFFDDETYLLSTDRRESLSPPLLDYLENWQSWDMAPSFLVDLKFLNHQLALLGISGSRDPLSLFLMNTSDTALLGTHPQMVPAALVRAFDSWGKHGAPPTVRHVVTGTHGFPAVSTRPERPWLSVIILNFFKPVLTYFAVSAALNALEGIPAEILVIETGGDNFHFEMLAKFFSQRLDVQFIKLRDNRFFGESNNFGVDLVSGEYILFLNNDCFLTSSFGAELWSYLHSPSAPDIVGAVLVYPDGKIQEFGGLVADSGEVIQRAKNLPATYLAGYTEPEQVDYVSAACLVIKKAQLERLAGFDPAFEPFYYEDTDLLRRARAAGCDVVVNPRLIAVHIENASTREHLGPTMSKMIADHRSLFARRWMQHKGAGALGITEEEPADFAFTVDNDSAILPTSILFTDFDIRAGGGERYFLSIARALAKISKVLICCEKEVSSARVRFALKVLGIKPFPFRVITRDELFEAETPDIFVSMGNEIVPPVPARGRKKLFHLQFPFPWRNVGRTEFRRLQNYDLIIVNTEFTKMWTERRLRAVGLSQHPPIHVIFPPVRDLEWRSKPNESASRPLRLINVGRFFVGGHSKRQDVLLDIVERARLQAKSQIEATLVGAVHDTRESQEYFQNVKSRAERMGDILIINDASETELQEALNRADVYLHCAGIGVREEAFPERLEHFGISIVEAIRLGCFPVVYAAGGPAEILKNTGYGRGYSTVAEAAELIAAYADDPDYILRARAALDSSWLDGLSDSCFDQQIREICADLLVTQQTHHLHLAGAKGTSMPIRLGEPLDQARIGGKATPARTAQRGSSRTRPLRRTEAPPQ